MISTAYSGTGALKTDFTRTGKRSNAGLLQDGVNSLMRYMKNNYFDGPRQVRLQYTCLLVRLLRLCLGCLRHLYWFMDAWERRGVIDLRVARPQASCNTFGKSSDFVVLSRLETRVADAIRCVVLSVHDLRRDDPASNIRYVYCRRMSKYQLMNAVEGYSLFYYFLIWIVILSLAVIFIIAHGIDYVAWPRLNPPSAVLYYDGPGFRSGRHGRGLSTSQAFGKLLGDKAGVADWVSSRRKRAFSRVSEIELGAKKRAD